MTALLLALLAAQAPHRGTVYVFFATWCTPCKTELPSVAALRRRYEPEGVRVVLVSVDGPTSVGKVPETLARVDPDLPWLHDAESKLLERYHPPATVPFSVVLDPAGRVRYAHAGYEPGDEHALEEAVFELVVQDPAPRAPAREGAAEADATITAVGEEAPHRVAGALQLLGARRSSRYQPGEQDAVTAGAARIEMTGETVLAGRGLHEVLAPVTVHARVDGAKVGGAGQDGSSAELERVYLDLALPRLAVRAGDGYARLGHGVTLSLRKLDALGLDTALRGGRAEAQLGPVRVLALGGFTNPQNLDPLELRVQADVWDRVAGGQVKLAPARGAWFGPYFLWVRAPDAAPDARDVTWTLGGAAGAYEGGGWRLAADAATGERAGLAPEAEVPWALYLRGARDLGPTTTLLEVKAYRRWQLGRPERALLYAEPPTLERADQVAAGNPDSAGARLGLQVRVAEGTAVSGSLMGYAYGEDGTSLDANRAWHGYASLASSPSPRGSVELGGGYRVQYRDGGERLRDLWHVELDGAVAATRSLGLSGRLQHLEEAKAALDGKHAFSRGCAAASATYRQWLSASFLWGYSTEAATRPTHYPGVELKAALPHGGEARLFAGRLAGGLVCVSGTCRDLPPFEGARFDLVWRM